MKVPLAEHFHSIQGEGTWVGTPMHFIRLAGCSVGKYIDPYAGPVHNSATPILPSGKLAWSCTTFDGTKFWCDTDFNKYEEVELMDLLRGTWEHHICITGGEPLIHTKLVEHISFESSVAGCIVHIETSGTIRWGHPDCWITASPKQGWLPEAVKQANELKLLISRDTKDDFPKEFLEHHNVFLSPINGAGTVQGDINNPVFSKGALQRCHELLRAHPSWRLSVQLHKYLGVR